MEHGGATSPHGAHARGAEALRSRSRNGRRGAPVALGWLPSKGRRTVTPGRGAAAPRSPRANRSRVRSSIPPNVCHTYIASARHSPNGRTNAGTRSSVAHETNQVTKHNTNAKLTHNSQDSRNKLFQMLMACNSNCVSRASCRSAVHKSPGHTSKATRLPSRRSCHTTQY